MAINWMFGFITVSILTLYSNSSESNNNLVMDRLVISLTTIVVCAGIVLLDWKWKFLIETKNKTPLEIVRMVNDIKVCSRE